MENVRIADRDGTAKVTNAAIKQMKKFFQKIQNARLKIPNYTARIAVGYGMFFILIQISLFACLALTQQIRKIQDQHKNERVARMHAQEAAGFSDLEKIAKLKKVFAAEK